jgi:hypothetical protein
MMAMCGIVPRAVLARIERARRLIRLPMRRITFAIPRGGADREIPPFRRLIPIPSGQILPHKHFRNGDCEAFITAPPKEAGFSLSHLATIDLYGGKRTMATASLRPHSEFEHDVEWKRCFSPQERQRLIDEDLLAGRSVPLVLAAIVGTGLLLAILSVWLTG